MSQSSLPARFFENAFGNIFISPSRRKLQKYFDEINRESLWVDLEGYFHPSKAAMQTLENEGLNAIFDACCINNKGQQVWNEDSFQNYLGIAHSEIATSKQTVHLLWTIFHHYAYHPFAPRSFEDTIDADGFRRAIMLLSARCTDILGTLEHDYHWTMVNEHVRNRNFERIFRIIGQPSIQTSLEDVMDALASSQPCFSYCELPSPQQKEVAARRLIGEDPMQADFRVSREDLSPLMALLLRLNVVEANSRAFSYHGSFDEANPMHEEMAEIVVDRMIGQGVGDMESDRISSAVGSLQNFYGRFQLLWAILLQPVHRDKPPKFSEVTDLIPHDIRGALSLLLLPSDASRMSWYSTGPYAWETFVQPPTKPSDPAVTHTECLLEQSQSARLILVTINETSSSPKIVWGVLFIGPLSFAGKLDDWTEWEAKSAHIFQIRPQLRWVNGFDSPDQLKMSINGEFTESFTVKTEGSTEPYSQGAKCIHLQLDWTTRSILLARSSSSSSIRQILSSEDVFVNGRVNYLRELDWETSARFDSIQILTVPGASGWNSGLVKPYPDQSQSCEQAVSRDELESRIQGFGPT